MSHLFYSEGNDLPNYELSRILGQTQGIDFDFPILADALDCQRDFYGAGITYNDGVHSFLVRPSKRATSSGEKELKTNTLLIQTE